MKNKIYNIEDLKKAIENYGWNVNECDFNCGTGWELYQHSPAGEDFGFAIEHNNNVEKAIEEIKQYANDFDIDEHIEMWVAGTIYPQYLNFDVDEENKLRCNADYISWYEGSISTEELINEFNLKEAGISSITNYELEEDIGI